ncbi:putative membrane protein [Wickerhamomyces ciferrii]|uniref:Pheromone-regulated membrane protein 10 n=1 Tax=Wickerhamomyces ciferrii (strain ATCC 14091 / BCRC 22168 / CBS 111 / JCM 3599 / NBRC 0793 / NRRL Y-1031 F-60-10) TaxID=1206466 RepID=K0KQZ5_WICCF|nr:uncharacterized protein BN7_5123 [Wickerhamomyces ciferrii]CCH45541.1 putative membrane protein [Wickerhamomyces ciferrii]
MSPPSSPGSGNSHYENASSKPPVRPQSPLQKSSSSILTMSKLYQQQQDEGSIHGSSTLSAGGGYSAPKNQISPGNHPAHSHRLHSPKPSSFLPKPSASQQNKKLHRRVLSGGSLKDDYFSTKSQKSNGSPGSPNSQLEANQGQGSAGSPGAVKLPTFQRMENIGTPPADEGHENLIAQTQQHISATQGGNGSYSDSSQQTHVSPNLSSSKIFDRRTARAQEFQDDADQTFKREFMSSTDLAENNDTFDPELDKQYNDKLTKLNEEKNQRKKNVEFYNSDDDGSDVDINSDSNDDPSNVKRSKSTKSKDVKLEKPQRSNTQTSTNSSNSSNSSNDGEKIGVKKLKNAFKKLVNPENYSSDDEDEDFNRNKPPEDNFFSKFVNISGGGLAPGASREEAKKKQDDEEAQRKIVSDEGVEMQTLDPELFKNEASGIVGAHGGRRGAAGASSFLNADEATLRDNASIHSHSESFKAPNPDLYLRDEDGIFEMNLDSSGDQYIAPPERVRGGVLSSLLKMYQNPMEASKSQQSLGGISETDPFQPNSGAVTPTEEYPPHSGGGETLAGRLKGLGKRKVAIDESESQSALNSKNQSTTDLGEGSSSSQKGSKTALGKLKSGVKNVGNTAYSGASFVGNTAYSGVSTAANTAANAASASSNYLPSFEKTRPKLKKGASNLKFKKEQAQARITVHIADILQRQRFVLRMCKALMLYGAPTHRLEEYLTMTARVLEIDGQFIYFPGCMIVSFGDATTRTSEVQLVRCPQGLNLYKLHRVHRIYKQVIHDLVGVEEASNDLDDLLSMKPAFPPWLCALLYAFASSMVTPFAFGGGWVNLPVSFLIGGCVGSLQFLIAPRSNLYSNVFEVTAAIVVSFVGRALGSIEGSGICFSSVVQGSLALILPGYIILCGSLELQSRNLVAGAVRMFYAIIYSLFLGFGITLGAALYGWIDKNATSETVCHEQISDWYKFLFVPMFTIGLCLINQAKWFQLPVMLFISCAGYVVNFFAGKHFKNSTEFTAAVGAFVIGVLGNLYSRIWKGLAVSAMLPAIFVQVPSGIASQASLLSGVQNANSLTRNSTTSSSSSATGSSLSFGVTMVEVAIGISVGLFASTIFVYPFGKKSTSVFTL